ncbi:hypothetical protein EBU24_02175 [bacterium]|nr:hypothetical protein [bacterium]
MKKTNFFAFVFLVTMFGINASEEEAVIAALDFALGQSLERLAINKSNVLDQKENVVTHTHSFGQGNIECLGCQINLQRRTQGKKSIYHLNYQKYNAECEVAWCDNDGVDMCNQCSDADSKDEVFEDASSDDLSQQTITQQMSNTSELSSDPDDDRLLDSRHGCMIL